MPRVVAGHSRQCGCCRSLLPSRIRRSSESSHGGSIQGPRPPHGASAATISNGLHDHTRAMPRPVADIVPARVCVTLRKGLTTFGRTAAARRPGMRADGAVGAVVDPAVQTAVTPRRWPSPQRGECVICPSNHQRHYHPPRIGIRGGLAHLRSGVTAITVRRSGGQAERSAKLSPNPA